MFLSWEQMDVFCSIYKLNNQSDNKLSPYKKDAIEWHDYVGANKTKFRMCLSKSFVQISHHCSNPNRSTLENAMKQGQGATKKSFLQHMFY